MNTLLQIFRDQLNSCLRTFNQTWPLKNLIVKVQYVYTATFLTFCSRNLAITLSSTHLPSRNLQTCNVIRKIRWSTLVRRHRQPSLKVSRKISQNQGLLYWLTELCAVKVLQSNAQWSFQENKMIILFLRGHGNEFCNWLVLDAVYIFLSLPMAW